MRILATIVSFLTFIGGCADQLILPPIPHPTKTDLAASHLLTREGRSIETFTARSRADVEPRAFVLRFTGGDAAGAAKFTAARWVPHPVEAWVGNYPGYGGS